LEVIKKKLINSFIIRLFFLIFISNVILNKSGSVDESGIISWQLVVSLFCAWLIVYAMVVRGIKVGLQGVINFLMKFTYN
jgi:hypothetical protein